MERDEDDEAEAEGLDPEGRCRVAPPEVGTFEAPEPDQGVGPRVETETDQREIGDPPEEVRRQNGVDPVENLAKLLHRGRRRVS